MTQRNLSSDDPIPAEAIDMTKRRKKPGKKPLAPGEVTERATTNLPRSLHKRAVKRAGRCGISAYIRSLIEHDLEAS